MIGEVRLSWAALIADGPPRTGVAVRLLEVSGLVGRVYLGIDEARSHHVLVESPYSDSAQEELGAVAIRQRDLVIDGAQRSLTDIVCLDVRLVEIFEHFAVALLDRLRGSELVPGVVARSLLDEWRRFLVAGATPPPASLCASLLGELLVLKEIVVRDPDRRVDVWTGPLGGRHDLRRGADAIEVKVTRSHEAIQVTVHGADQMQEPPGGTLTLGLLRLEHAPGGSLSLPGVLDDLIDLGVPASTLYARVAAGGIAPGDLSLAGTMTFELREWLSWDVSDGFPRVLDRSFVGGALPQGLSELTYRIDLTHARDHLLSADQLNERLTRMAVQQLA